MLYSIRNKIILCFLIPIVFMIIVGIAAYNKASDGLQDKFMESTGQTIYMAMGRIPSTIRTAQTGSAARLSIP